MDENRVLTAEEIAALRQAMDLLLEEFEAQVGDRVRPLRRARDGAGRSGNQGYPSLRVPPRLCPAAAPCVLRGPVGLPGAVWGADPGSGVVTMSDETEEAEGLPRRFVLTGTIVVMATTGRTPCCGSPMRSWTRP